MLPIIRRLPPWLKSALDRQRSWRQPVWRLVNLSQARNPVQKGRLRWFHSLLRLGAQGALLSAIPYLPSSGKDKPAVTKSPGALSKDSAEGLSHSQLVKNAASVAVDASCVLVTHCALAAIAAHQEYAKRGHELKKLIEEHTQFAKTPTQEDELWQEIIRQRVELDDQAKQMEESEAMVASAIMVVERAAEAAYQADAELSSLMAGQHLELVRTQMDAARKMSRRAEKELSAIQAQSIQATGEGSETDAEPTHT